MPVPNSAGELGRQLAERGCEHVLAPDDHIVIAWRHVTCSMNAQRLLEAAADAVALDRVSGLFGDGEADARRRVVAALEHLEQEQASAPFLAFAHGDEFAAPGQAAQLRCGEPAVVRQYRRFRQAESRLRPRLRRAATTPRPPLVAMRARKP